MLDEKDLQAIAYLIDTKLAPIHSELSGLKTDFSGLKEDVSTLKEDVSTLKEDVSGLKTEVAAIRLDIENRIDPALETLAEGQKTLLETMAPKTRVDALEDELAFHKQILKSLVKDVNDLKKAQ